MMAVVICYHVAHLNQLCCAFSFSDTRRIYQNCEDFYNCRERLDAGIQLTLKLATASFYKRSNAARVYTGTHVAGYKLYPLVAVNMYLASATKLSPVCRLSVAGYQWISRP